MAEFERAEELVVGLYRRGEGLPPANRIIDIGVSRTLRSGVWSPYLINLRPVLSFDTASPLNLTQQADLSDLMLDAYVDRLDRIERGFDHIYGEPEAGTPLVAAIGTRGGFSMIWRRVDPKSKQGRGKHQALEGIVYPGQKVAQVDDVVTRGETATGGKRFLTDQDLISRSLTVLADRQQGAADDLREVDIAIDSAFGATAMFGYLLGAGALDQTEHDFLVEYTLGTPPTEEPSDHPWKKKEAE